MKIRFYVDPETEAPHIHSHAVNEDEVADVLASPGEDPVSGEKDHASRSGAHGAGAACESSTFQILSGTASS